jgi:CDP-diacylglycerol--serine O-phosphatidyltransferase
MLKYLRLPDLFSCGALVVALSSIYLSISGHYWLGLAILPGAALLDTLDGFAARSMRRQDSFGRELDSLVDMVAYGVTLDVFWIASGHQTVVDFACATLLTVALAVRLAGFNIKAAGEPYLGLPSGWNAWLFPLVYFLGYGPAFPVLFVISAVLMIAPVPIPKLGYRLVDGKIAISFDKS